MHSLHSITHFIIYHFIIYLKFLVLRCRVAPHSCVADDDNDGGMVQCGLDGDPFRERRLKIADELPLKYLDYDYY